MNWKLLNYFKLLFILQFSIQFFNLYGLKFQRIEWLKIFHCLFILSNVTIFNSFNEKKFQFEQKIKNETQKFPVFDTLIHFLIALFVVMIPSSSFFSSLLPFSTLSSQFSLWSIVLQLILALFSSSPLWIPHPYDILITSQSLKLPLVESSLFLCGYWSLYLTFFTAIYPPLSILSLHHSVLFEITPVLLHIFTVFVVNYVWIMIAIYTHHRMQFIVDCRRCGVWIKLPSPSSSSSSQPSSSSTTGAGASSSKSLPWKPLHSYRHNETCLDDNHTYQLITHFSSYSFSPSATSKLPYKHLLYSILNKESGPLSQSFILSFLLQCLSVVCCCVLVIGLLYPRQQQIGFYVHGVVVSVLLYGYQKTFLSPRVMNPNGVTYTSSDTHFIYHPYQQRVSPQDTPQFPGTMKGKQLLPGLHSNTSSTDSISSNTQTQQPLQSTSSSLHSTSQDSISSST